MLADADGALTRAIGLVVSLPALGLGERSERYSMVVEDAVVKMLNVEKGVLDPDPEGPPACSQRHKAITGDVKGE